MPYQHDGNGNMEYLSNEPENGKFNFDSEKVEKRLSNHRRRAKAHGCVSEKISVDDIYNIIVEQQFRCKYSHDPLDDSWEIEHIIELVNGGDNTLNNLVVVGRHYNRSKGSRGLDYLSDKQEADIARREHHMNDWEGENDLGYMTHVWNRDYADSEEEEVHLDWADLATDLDDIDTENRSTMLDEEDFAGFILS